jgi:hypothetical protein
MDFSRVTLRFSGDAQLINHFKTVGSRPPLEPIVLLVLLFSLDRQIIAVEPRRLFQVDKAIRKTHPDLFRLD